MLEQLFFSIATTSFSKYKKIGDFSTALRIGEDYIRILDYRINVIKLALRRVVNLRSGGVFCLEKGKKKSFPLLSQIKWEEDRTASSQVTA